MQRINVESSSAKELHIVQRYEKNEFLGGCFDIVFIA